MHTFPTSIKVMWNRNIFNEDFEHQVTVSISYDDNHYTMSATFIDGICFLYSQVQILFSKRFNVF